VKRAVKKAMLDKQVAVLLGQKTRDVAVITETFLAAIREELVEMNTVRLDGLGTLKIHEYEGKIDHLASISGTRTVTTKKKHRVSFKKSRPLSLALRERFGGVVVEKAMEKYGVDESQKDNEKVASDGCPLCGAQPERHGNVLACPTHGTEPFEKKK
jgi:nucleoid DNA-binding protein